MGLQIGDKLPFFTAKDSEGNDFEIKEYIGQPLVIYFYPKDETRVCTEQACSFRDNYEDFKNLGEKLSESAATVFPHIKSFLKDINYLLFYCLMKIKNSVNSSVFKMIYWD
jgi:peroxiredoxin Q/BCP